MRCSRARTGSTARALTRCARRLVETYGEGANGAAATIQAAWRGHRFHLVAERWRALVAELRDAVADEEEEDVVAELPEDDGLQTHAPVASSSSLLRAISSTLTASKSAKIPQTRVSSVHAEREGKLTPAAASQPQPQRRRRTKPSKFTPDREGEFVSINNETKAVSSFLLCRGGRDSLTIPEQVARTRDGKRVAYPAVVRSWLDANARAVEVAAADAPRVRTVTPAGLFPLLSTRITSVGVGEGVVLYFTWLKMLARLFCVMGIIATPACIFNVMAQRRFKVFSDRQDIFAQVTLGTQQVSNAVEVAAAGGAAGINTADTLYYGYRKETILFICSLLDVSYMLVFVITVTVMRVVQGRLNKREQAESLSIGRFSVLVSKMPRTPATVGLASSLRQHFEQAYGRGSVAEVALATACASELRLFRSRNAALVRRRNAAALINASRGAMGTSQLAAAVLGVRMADAAIERAYAYSSVPTCVAAFVTFETAPLRDRCVAEHGSLRAVLFPPTRLLYKGTRPLTVTPAPEPTNLNWTHLEFGRVSRFFRGALTNCLAVSLMIGTAAIIIAASQSSSEVPLSVNQADTLAAGMLNCEAIWPLAAATSDSDPARMSARDLASRIKPDQCALFVGNGVFLGYGQSGTAEPPFSPLYGGAALAGNASLGTPAYACAAQVCWRWSCTSAGVQAWLSNERESREFCQDYWTSEFRTTALLLGATGTVAVTNIVFRFLIKALTRFEKHHTVSAAEAAIAFKFMLSTIINTLIIFLFAYGAVMGYPDGLLNIRFLFGGRYYSFTRDWYSEVGASLIRTLALNSVISCFLTWIMVGIVRSIRRSRRPGVITQQQLDETYMHFNFELAQRYGEQTAFIFLVLMLSSGLPVLIWFGCAYFLIWFWSDKTFLLRASRTPVAYDSALSRFALKLLPWAAALHFAFGTWMYADAGTDSALQLLHRTVGSSGVAGVTVDDGLRQNTDLSSQFNFRTRILKVAALPQFVGLLLITAISVLIVLLRVIRRIVGVFFAACAACCNDTGIRKEVNEIAARLPFLSDARFETVDPAASSPEARAKGQWSGPTSYAMIHDARFASLFADPITGAAVNPASKPARGTTGLLTARAHAAAARAAVEGFVVFDSSAAVKQASVRLGGVALPPAAAV